MSTLFGLLFVAQSSSNLAMFVSLANGVASPNHNCDSYHVSNIKMGINIVHSSFHLMLLCCFCCAALYHWQICCNGDHLRSNFDHIASIQILLFPFPTSSFVTGYIKQSIHKQYPHHVHHPIPIITHHNVVVYQKSSYQEEQPVNKPFYKMDSSEQLDLFSFVLYRPHPIQPHLTIDRIQYV